MFENILVAQDTIQISFWVCLLLTILTLPLKDIITVGFYDISDFFVTLLISLFIVSQLDGVLEVTKSLLIIIFISVLVVIILLNIFVVLPFKSRAENSTLISNKQLEGREGKVSVPLTIDSMGEVIVYTGFTKVNKMAKIYVNDEGITNIPLIATVIVVESKGSVLYVLPYENSIKQVGKQKSTWNEQ